MIQATFTPDTLIAGADGARTIGGVAVPFGVVGHLSSGQRVIFEPGSIDPGSRPVALRDHDRNRPVGRVVDAVDTGPAMRATVRASRTTDGNDALALAGDGVLMFSIGATPTDFTHDADGVMHVAAASWDELTLLTFGAYAAAQIDTVQAQGGQPAMITDTDDPTTTDPIDPDANPDAPIVDPDVDDDPDTPDEPAQGLTAAAIRPTPRQQPRRDNDMTLERVGRLLAGAGGERGQRVALQAIRAVDAIQQAALVDVTMVGTNNVGALYRPAYQAELVEIVSWGRPLINALKQGTLERGDYPNKTFNKWTQRPTVGIQTPEKTAITSTIVKIDPTGVPVQTWAGGNDLSQQALDFGSPSFVSDYIDAAAIDYAKKSDTYAVTTLLAAAMTTPPGAAAAFTANVAALFGTLNPANVPAGRLFLCVSWDVMVSAIGVVGITDNPAFWSGAMDLGNMMPANSMGGLSMFVDPNMPANTMLLGLSSGATWYERAGSPYNLQVTEVSLLGLNVAVYGYGALGVQYPGAFAKMTVTP